ncbi:BZ3500_MvSof-1268-A1-R1_Chr3-3g06594 [Microbotryum saponariae]|uniref:BZ3500_MvSof-1268-A1-R1_Chr3-3g06594 protein n=1 Tax=Microbotryum saponariae TaxID=289078 RepID=A0A2X0LGW0_9BASI|nr:BZ3500_MvSof-1268-A1-R1_Chr3-3g06594 [Microbotryum saponariae]SDA04561.1 BZ3501_MvSof-1269-A2-R1_Chr3-2g06281 [Microbotryum saponariae]
MQAQSTKHLTRIIVDVFKGVRTLYRLNILNLDISVDNIGITADGTGCLTLSNWPCFLDDPLSEQDRLEAVGTLATMARAILPTLPRSCNKPRIKQEVWHVIEQVVFTVLYIVASRPSGPISPQRMSQEDQKLWALWDTEDAELPMSKGYIFRKPQLLESILNQYTTFWTDLPRLVAVMAKYCGLGQVSDCLTIREEETVMGAQWGGRDGAARLLDAVIDELQMLLVILVPQDTSKKV